MNIYQDAAGGWIVFDGAVKHFYATEGEARQAMAKLGTAQAIIQAVQSLATATDTAADLEAEYFDTQGTGWVDADVEGLGITAAQLAGCLTLLQQLNLLMTGAATTPIVHRTVLNAVRRVGA